MVLAHPRDTLYPPRRPNGSKITLKFRYCGVVPLGCASSLPSSGDRPPVQVSLNFPSCSSLELHAHIDSRQSTAASPFSYPPSKSHSKQLGSVIICEDLKMSDDCTDFAPPSASSSSYRHLSPMSLCHAIQYDSSRAAANVDTSSARQLHPVQLVCKCDISVIVAHDDPATRSRAKTFAMQKGRAILRTHRVHFGQQMLLALKAANAGSYSIQGDDCGPVLTASTPTQPVSAASGIAAASAPAAVSSDSPDSIDTSIRSDDEEEHEPDSSSPSSP